MRTITTNVYHFHELADDVKAKVCKRFRGESSYPHFDASPTIEWWADVLTRCGIKIEDIGSDIQYAGFGNQGDGASFEATIDLHRLAEVLSTPLPQAEDDPATMLSRSLDEFPNERKKLWASLLMIDAEREDFGLEDVSMQVIIDRRFPYSHERACRVEWHLDYYPFNVDKWEATFAELASDVDVLRSAICRKLYKELESENDYHFSDEAIGEFLTLNEYEFFADGRSF